jgi:short-subunit dehydrogenase involved in D-alanine esterification of teichoic acids
MPRNKSKNPMKEVANILNDIHSLDVDVEDDMVIEEFVQKIKAIDWKLWEILKILQKFDEEEEEAAND